MEETRIAHDDEHGTVADNVKAVKGVHKQGYLVKAPMSQGRASLRASAGLHGGLFGGFGPHYKKSHRRYFVLEGSTLSYFEREGEAKAKGSLELSPDAVIEVIADNSGLVVVPFPGSKKELFVTSEDPKELTEWQASIRDACKLARPRGEETEEKEADNEDEDDEDDVAEEPVMESKRASDAKADPRASVKSTQSAGEPEWKREWQQRVTPRTRLPTIKYEIVKEGHLEMKARSGGSWAKQYLVLTKDLYAYESLETFEGGKNCKQVPLEAIKVAKAADAHEITVFAIGESYRLRGASAEEVDDWADKLSNLPRYLRVQQTRPRRASYIDKASKHVPDFLANLTATKSRADSEPISAVSDHEMEAPPLPVDDDKDAEAENEVAVDAVPSPKAAPRVPPPVPKRVGAEAADLTHAVPPPVPMRAGAAASTASGDSGAIEAPADEGAATDRFAKLRALRAKREQAQQEVEE